MYLRITERRNRDGSTVAYYALAESVWNADAKRPEAAWCTISAAPTKSTAPHCSGWSTASTACSTLARAVAARHASHPGDRHRQGVRTRRRAHRPQPLGGSRHRPGDPRLRRTRSSHSAARDRAVRHGRQPARGPGSKLACAERWLPDIAWLPDAAGLAVDQLYRALDFLAVWSDEIERDVFLKTADLFRLDVDLIFYDTTTAYFEIDDAGRDEQEWGGRLYAPLRRRGHSKEGRDNQPQVIIALAVTRDGMPVRSWVLPGDTADVATRGADQGRSARLAARPLPVRWRCRACIRPTTWPRLSRGLGRYILAVPMRKLKDIEAGGADPSGPLQTGGRQSAGQRGRGSAMASGASATCSASIRERPNAKRTRRAQLLRRTRCRTDPAGAVARRITRRRPAR